MLKPCFTFYLLFLPVFGLFSQSGIDHNAMMVIEKRGGILRNKPSAKGVKITALPFGTMLTDYFHEKQNSIPDTINNISGDWLHVKYEEKTGYIFSAYVDLNSQTYNHDFQLGLPQFLDENWQCGEFTFFNPQLHWYGLYDIGNNKAELQEVDIRFEKHNSLEDADGLDFGISIITAQPKESLFLIGLPKSAEKKTIRYKPLPIKYTPYGQAFSNNIYPGEKYFLGYDKSTKTSFTLECHGSVSNGGPAPEGSMKFDKYEVKVVAYNSNAQSSQTLDLKAIDEILFIGDLNNDKIDDLIIRDRLYPNASQTVTYLMMSGYGDQTLTKVAENYWGGCY